MKYAKMLIRRQDNEGKIMKHVGLFKQIPCVDLIEVDKVEACCIGVRTGCTFMRTKEKLPAFMEGTTGPLIRAITTLDHSERLEVTYSNLYANMSNSTYFKYNKNNYYWYLDGHIYIPNVDWEGIRIEAIFDEEISDLICSLDPRDCVREQDRELAVPDYLFAEIEQLALKEVLTSGQIPSDGADDSQNILR